MIPRKDELIGDDVVDGKLEAVQAHNSRPNTCGCT